MTRALMVALVAIGAVLLPTARASHDAAPARLAPVQQAPVRHPPPRPAQTRHRPPPPPRAIARAAYHRMSRGQRIGQLFVAGVASSGGNTGPIAIMRRLHLGGAILDGSSDAGRRAIRRSSGQLVPALTHSGVAPFVSADQEGGLIQRLAGRGFSRIPTALNQGRMAPAALTAASRTWGRQLGDAGVNLDLGPVADVVPAEHASSNQPIGRYRREFGHTSQDVRSHVVAFQRGMTAAGVAVAVKHFPGIGRASGDTDTARHVTDPTTRHDPYLRPFQAAVSAGAPFVMVSSATYPNLDPAQPACFSRTVISSMLRRQLGFRGVVISDDLSAAAVAGTPPRQRALRFLAAGGTMLLDTSLAEVEKMDGTLRRAMAAKPAVAHAVRAAVLTDLVAKVNAGLVHS